MSKFHGSVHNRVLSSRVPKVKPEVGMGVTECLWSDRYAWEIVEVIDEKHAIIRKMDAKCKDWYAGDWEVFPDPNGEIRHLVFRYGRWRDLLWDEVWEDGRVVSRTPSRRLGTNGWRLGSAEEYRDPSF